jgi:hypothetical protein
LAGFTIPFLIIVLLSLLLDNDSIHVNQSHWSKLQQFFLFYLLLENINILCTINNNILCELFLIDSKNLSLLNDAAKIIIFIFFGEYIFHRWHFEIVNQISCFISWNHFLSKPVSICFDKCLNILVSKDTRWTVG